MKDITVEEVVASWRRWSPEQRSAFGRGAGIVGAFGTDAIIPVMAEELARPCHEGGASELAIRPTAGRTVAFRSSAG